MRDLTLRLLALALVWASTGFRTPALACGPVTSNRSASNHPVQSRQSPRPSYTPSHSRLWESRPRDERQATLAFVGPRDPFRLPRPSAPGAGPAGIESRLAAYLPPGNGGLLISHLTLQGVLSEDSGQNMIAIVSNETQRAYFLRQNEAVYDGTVIRISPDAIFFRQRYTNAKGESRFRYVVRPLTRAQGVSK